MCPTVGGLNEDLCREETEEASMLHCKQTQIPCPAKVEEEAEAEELGDVKEVRRNLKLLAQLDGEKYPEEFWNVQGTHLVEIEERQKRPQLQKI